MAAGGLGRSQPQAVMGLCRLTGTGIDIRIGRRILQVGLGKTPNFGLAMGRRAILGSSGALGETNACDFRERRGRLAH